MSLDVALLLLDHVFSKEFCKSGWNVVRIGSSCLSSDFFVQQVALKDRIGAHFKDGNERVRDKVRNKEDQDDRPPNTFNFGHGVDNWPRAQASSARDEAFGEEHEDVGDAIDESELGSVLEDQDKGVER